MSSSSVTYECVRCQSHMTLEELGMRGEQVKCVVCGYKILRKIKPPVVKRVPAI